ncbi:MAG: putative addiction module antidote protein [Elusimicrobia bacterium]|nr:putative addiction module antidote protein [Elusimicrobiota bacterium]
MRPYIDFDRYLQKRLKDPKEAAAYLNAALEENDPDFFLVAYYDVARAHGMKALADKARLHRVSLKKMLSKGGNPEWKSLFRVLAASKLRIRVEAVAPGRR